jgi:hypothetical protein
MKKITVAVLLCYGLTACGAPPSVRENLREAQLEAGAVPEDVKTLVAIGMAMRASNKMHEVVRVTHGDPSSMFFPTVGGIATQKVLVRLESRPWPGTPAPTFWTKTWPEDECLSLSFAKGRLVGVSLAGLGESCSSLPHDITEMAKFKVKLRPDGGKPHVPGQTAKPAASAKLAPNSM